MDRNSPFDLASVFEPEDYLYFYSDMLTDARSDEEVAALVKLLELQPGMKVLDLACGFGRHANRLAALGHEVTGVDYLEGFLSIARAQAAQMGVHVRYRQADMRRVDFAGEFDRVILMFTSFGYFDDTDNLLVLENIARALKPGGWLGFDLPNRDATLKTLPPAAVVEKNNDLLINRNSFDALTGRWHNQRLVIRNGIRKDKPFSIRLYNPTEIQAMLAQAGLEVRHWYADWRANPLTSDSRGLVILVQKRGVNP